MKEGDAEAGDFINTLTGEVLNGDLEFIVAYYQPGRFAADRKTNRAYTAFGDTIPASWADLVGEEFVGSRFDEYPDAEETYKARVNAGEIEWDKGPLVSTTHNYTGFVLVEPEEDAADDETAELRPVRLSLQRINMPAVRKLTSIKRALLRNKPFWDITFKINTTEKAYGSYTAYILNVRTGRKTTADEQSQAADLAVNVLAGKVVSNEAADEPAKPATEPDAAGGLAV